MRNAVLAAVEWEERSKAEGQQAGKQAPGAKRQMLWKPTRAPKAHSPLPGAQYWLCVARSRSQFHLSPSAKDKTFLQVRESQVLSIPRMATSAPPQFAKNLIFLLAAPEPAAGGARPPPRWGTQAQDELSFMSQTAQPAKAQRPHSQGEL